MKGFIKVKKKLEETKTTHIRAGIVAAGLVLLFIPALGQQISIHNSYYKIEVDEQIVGYAETKKQADEAILAARARVDKKEDKLVMVAVECKSSPAGRFVFKLDEKEALSRRIYETMCDNMLDDRESAYTVKVADKVVTVKNLADVESVLKTVAAKYDKKGRFEVQLDTDEEKGLHVLTAGLVSADVSQKETVAVMKAGGGGKDKAPVNVQKKAENSDGLVTLRFAEDIQIMETTAKAEEIGSADEAAAQIEEELAVVSQKKLVYEESYKEKVKYVDNSSWYTTKQKVRQEGKAGKRKVTALVSYRNGKEISRKVLGKTVVKKAVQKIVERGTKEPPKYIYPISGGRFSSGFGGRWGRVHKGIDLATPIGTPVVASRGGTVSYSGTMNGYGYIVIINHGDGTSTRYGHLSKCIARNGQRVKQGELIALSGNTGRSTGPHVHFEIRIGAEAVNPLKYL